MAIDQKTTALAIPDRRHELQEMLAAYPADKYILLVPSTEFGFSPMFRPVISEVRLSTAEGSKDIYSPGGGRAGEVAIHATGLNRIANALAITWENARVDETKRWKWRAEAAGWILHPNGDRIRHVGRYTLDVSDDEAVIVKRIRSKAASRAAAAQNPRDRQKALDDAERDIDSYRQFGEQRAETGARSRVIQWAANLQKTYSLAELSRKSFAALHWRPDERHPQVAEALIKRMGQATDVVFGQRQEALPAEIQGTVRSVDAGEGDEADVVGAFDAATTDPGDEPEPEIPPAEAGPKAPTQEEVAAIAAAALTAVAKRPEGERAQPVDDGLLTIVGTQLRDALTLEPHVQRTRWPIVRVAILRGLFGVTKSKAASVAQARVLIDMTKDPQGQAQLRRLFAWSLEKDPTLVEVAADLARPEQQTLAGAAEVLR